MDKFWSGLRQGVIVIGFTIYTAIVLFFGSFGRYQGTAPIWLRAHWDSEFTLPQVYWVRCDEVYYCPPSAESADSAQGSEVRIFFMRNGREVGAVSYRADRSVPWNVYDLDAGAAAKAIVWNDGEQDLIVFAFSADTLFTYKMSYRAEDYGLHLTALANS